MEGLTTIAYGFLGFVGLIVAIAVLLAVSKTGQKKGRGYSGKKSAFGGKKKYKGKKKSSGIW